MQASRAMVAGSMAQVTLAHHRETCVTARGKWCTAATRIEEGSGRIAM
jgi:hypothetical protein